MQKRLNRKEYFLEVVEAVALRGTCDRGRSGAIIIRGNRIVSTGYVGAPTGLPHCDQVGHELVYVDTNYELVEKEHCVRTVHAEMNAIIQAAKFGNKIAESHMYCTMFPCYECAKAIVNAGIMWIVSKYDYQDSERSKKLFTQVGISYEIKFEYELDYDK